MQEHCFELDSAPALTVMTSHCLLSIIISGSLLQSQSWNGSTLLVPSHCHACAHDSGLSHLPNAEHAFSQVCPHDSVSVGAARWVLDCLKRTGYNQMSIKLGWVLNIPPATDPSPQLDGSASLAPGSSTVQELCQHGILSLNGS